MPDHELKKLLLETCPIRPGQEGRAWDSLKGRLDQSHRSRWNWLYLPSWQGAAVAVAVLVLIPIVGDLFRVTEAHGLSTADSKSPGIYATAFYSRSAGAQVVWLNGMDPASDRPTYLDPTTVVGEAPHAEPSRQPVGDPNSL
jgi:hypothetical protein